MWLLCGLLGASQCYKMKYELSGKAAKARLWLDKLIYARSLLEFEKQGWLVLEMVPVFLQWGQVERSTTLPWDLSFFSSGGPESPPTVYFFPFSQEYEIGLLWYLGLLEEVCVQMLTHFPHLLVDFAWSNRSASIPTWWSCGICLETTSTNRVIQVKCYMTVCFSKADRGKIQIGDRPPTGKHCFSLDTRGRVTASLGLYPTVWIPYGFA